MENSIDNLSLEIDKIINLIQRGHEIQARQFFNSLIPKYSQHISSDTNLHYAVEIWTLLDEYLNADDVDENFSDRKKFLLSAYNDFLIDFKGSLI